MKSAGISIHALLAESDLTHLNNHKVLQISIHALLAESDGGIYTRAPIRGYFYPRSPCGERLHLPVLWSIYHYISIHALLAESDGAQNQKRCKARKISIHALLAESDSRKPTAIANTPKFLSTLSLRRATRHTSVGKAETTNFYPRSPCGERPMVAPPVSS